MKAIVFAALCLAALGGSDGLAQVPFNMADDGQWQKAANTHRQAQFPKIHKDGRVWFQLAAPQTASSVKLVMGTQSFDMQKDTAGRWNLVLPRIEPGYQLYSFNVDGMTVADPGSAPFYMGGYTSVLEYPSPTEDFYEPKHVPHGDVRERWFYSQVTGSWRRMFVYTPPGYEKDTGTRYPVLYLQHGGGEDESEWAHSGRANFILDNLIAQGKARPMIIVMNNGFVTRPNQAAGAAGGGYQRGFADAFQEVLLKEVIPDIDATYRTIPDARHRALTGLSMGGGQAFYVGLGNTGTFGSVGLFGTGVFGGIRSPGGVESRFNAEEQIPGLLTTSASFNDALDLFYIAVGEQDPRHEATRAAVAAMRAGGLEVEFASFPGEHEWRTWRRSLHDFAQRLFRSAPAETGPHAAIYEELATLPGHVVYRPRDLPALGDRKLGIYAYGNGGCSADGTNSKNHLLEIASHGYLAIAPGTIPQPGKPIRRTAPSTPGKLHADTPVEALREAIDWAIRENGRPESPFYGRIATDQVAVSGWSCGGLQALLTATDPRVKTSIIMNSGIYNDGGNPIEGIDVDKTLLDRIHGSVLYVLGSPSDMAYPNGMDDYRRLTNRSAAVVNIPVGHGGTFAQPAGGLGTQVTVAWLDWQLRGSEEAGKQFRGSACGYCNNARLTIERKSLD